MTTDAKPQKSTIYLDAEDEITAIIDKVKSAHGSIVAVVPPKRAAALQSVVNLKLLQRAARSSKKNLVLVTTEPSLLPLAGTVGMMVAKTTSSKPEVPPSPDAPTSSEDIDEVVESGEDPVDTTKSVGELAGVGSAAPTDKDGVETVELDNSTPAAAAAAPKTKKDKKAAKADKKLKVPNFNTFRKKMLLAGGGLVVLIILFVIANIVLPRATIIIKTDTTSTDISLNVTGSASATAVNTEDLVVPTITEEYKQTDTEKASATGKKNVGEKATGSVVMQVCAGFEPPSDVPAGTQLSSGGQTYVTQQAASFTSDSIGSGCIVYTTNTVNIAASEGGSAGNTSGATFDVGGGSGATASGSASGGTDKTVATVSQTDVDSAKQKVIDEIKNSGEAELKKQFQEQNAVALSGTLKAGEPAVTASPNVGSEASEVTVSVTVTYTQVGVSRDDLNKIIETQAGKQIDTSKQRVQDTGIDNAVFTVTSNNAEGVRFQLQTIAQAGPQLDADGIKQEIAGKKRGETESIILGRPGIRDVEINYSPFWVHGTPSRTGKITITFESANAQ